MTAGCGEEWTPTTGAEQLRAGLRQPNWRDDPDQLAALCEQGCRDLHGSHIPGRRVETIPNGRYL